jgi:hypothetical protein
MKKTTTIFCGSKHGKFHYLIENRVYCGKSRAIVDGVWFFPEIDYGHQGGPVARHPSQILAMVSELVGLKIVTMSEHIVLAFQQLVRQKKIERASLRLYCGDTPVYLDDDGDLEYWPNGFFNERLELLR